jgi:alkylation response protein AidB-like acyl-CoA dehydrogenase
VARGSRKGTAIRSRLGRADAAVVAARLAVERAAELVDARPAEPETNRWIYRAKLLAGDVAMEASASLAEACGLGALTRGSAVERAFRDARFGAVMPPRSDVCVDYLGAVMLGLDPQADLEDPPW